MKKDGTFGRIQEPSFSELSSQNVFNTASDLIAISYLERIQSQQNSKKLMPLGMMAAIQRQKKIIS